MTTNVSTQKLIYIKPLGISRLLNALHIPMPRPRTVLTASLLIGSFTLIMLMLLGILPLSLLLGFLIFAMLSSGGILALIFCGEI